jgi:diacylglycerol kinase family enzyme
MARPPYLRPVGATVAPPLGTTRRRTRDPRRVILLCNPRAGGRWKELAGILDHPAAQHVRRIVTDDVDDVREALGGMGRRTDLLCIYGGDGTIFRVLDQLGLRDEIAPPRIALLGGGTMNVTARALGMRRSPAENFAEVMKRYAADALTWREVPLVEVDAGAGTHVGFTFAIGPLVRLLEAFEGGSKKRWGALALGARSIGEAVLGADRGGMLAELEARVWADDELLPHERWAAVFANTTGTINPYVRPFVGERGPDRFHFLAYATSARNFALLAPLLARGHLPVDPKALREPLSNLRRALLSLVGRDELPTDPRFINRPARALTIECAEPRFTLDGELLPREAPRIQVRLGPAVRLAVLPPRGKRRFA